MTPSLRSSSAQVLAMLMLACAADPGPPDGGAVADDASLDAQPDAPLLRPGDVTITVAHPAPGTLDAAPLAGAVLGIAQDGALVAELTTDAEGTARVTVDWARGPLSVTAFAIEHRPRSWVEIEETSDLALSVEWSGLPPNRGLITGAVLNREPGRPDVVTATAAPFVWSINADTYSLELETEQPFAIVAYEFGNLSRAHSPRGSGLDVFRWAFTTAPALGDTKAMQDIDFVAHAVTPEIMHARLVIPGDAAGVLATTGMANFDVRANWASNAFIGTSTLCDLAVDGIAFDCECSVARVDHPTVQPLVRYAINTRGEASGVHVAGYPVDGAIIDTFPTPPVVTAPAIDTNGSFAMPIELTVDEGTDEVRLSIRDRSSQAILWDIRAPGDASSIVVPPVPAAMATEMESWAEQVDADLESCHERVEASDDCMRYAFSRTFRLDR